MYVGKGKYSLDEADVNLCMSPVVSMFGAFVNFIVASSKIRVNFLLAHF